jgi:hypothetical protein
MYPEGRNALNDAYDAVANQYLKNVDPWSLRHEIITPGTIIEESIIETGNPNYLVSIVEDILASSLDINKWQFEDFIQLRLSLKIKYTSVKIFLVLVLLKMLLIRI